MPMNIFFRVDASSIIGTGHVIRCLTLAKKLRSSNFNCIFICRPQKGDLIELIALNQFQVLKLNRLNSLNKKNWLGVDIITDADETMSLMYSYDVDWVIVDNYFIDNVWEKKLYTITKNIMVIDDLANRVHFCDVLLDQNYHGDKTSLRYNNLVPKECRKFLGPQYGIIGDEYLQVGKIQKNRDGSIHNILIFMGGSDPKDETMKIVTALEEDIFLNLNINVVVGSNYPNFEQLKKYIKLKKNMKLYFKLPSLSSLMKKADLMISGGGSVTLERMAMGLPAIVIGIAENQMDTNKALMNSGFITFLGNSDFVNSKKISSTLQKTIVQKNINKQQSQSIKKLINLDFMNTIISTIFSSN